MNEAEIEILDYLNNSYSGARAFHDEECCVRLARAIAAFTSDPEEDPKNLFTENFIDKYVIGIKE